MRALVVVVALIGCKQSDPPPPPKPVPPPPPPPVAVAQPCANIDLVLVSTILEEAGHPCRARVDAVYGRMMATGAKFSGTLVTTKPTRGAGLVVTCLHCTGPDGHGLHDPEIPEPSTFQTRGPAHAVGSKVLSGRETQLFFLHRLYSVMPPKTALDKLGHLTNIEPRHDFVVATISGTPVEVVGHIGAMPNATVSDTKLAVHDPETLLAGETWGNAQTGKQVLVLGFPSDLPDHAFGGELVASVGEVLDDARAQDMLLRADPDEAAIAYDPAIEFIVAAHASSGMSGGGAFDDAGRYLGIAVRGTVKPVDGKYLVRVVRAQYVFDQLDAALAKAPEAMRAKLTPFVAR